MVILVQFMISAGLGIATWLIASAVGMQSPDDMVLGLIVFLLCMGALIVFTDDIFD